MSRPVPPHPNQLPLCFDNADELDRLIETRVAERCAAEAGRWRFRLLVIESVLFATLVGVSGLLLRQPGALVLQATLLVGLSCFVSGILLLWLSSAGTRLLARLKRWPGMNGLLSAEPSASAPRLAVGGYILLFGATFTALLEPELAGQLRAMVWLVLLVSGMAFVGALCGLPSPQDLGGRRAR
ncbi:hypothetical protein [Sphingomonas sp. OTU376]|uniref:hypothetical protein n=1 Tax=Sphingomonas sp. OTU376 TaxID=3043863 RepID=UPI00313B32FC